MITRWRRALTLWRRIGRCRPCGTPALECEPMERRALMAANPVASAAPVAPSTVTVSTVVSTAPGLSIVITAPPSAELVSAVNLFLRDLEEAFAPGNSGLTDEKIGTLRSDLRNLVMLAGASQTKTAARLDADLSSFLSAGEITPVSRMRLIDDLESLVLSAGAPAQIVLSAAGEAIRSRSATSTDALDQALVDPNSLISARAGSKRGQDTSPSSASPPIVAGSVGIVRPESGTLGRSFRSLLDDLKAILGNTPTISPGQKTAIRNDFAAVAIRAKRPDPDLLATLKADLDAIAIDGHINDDGRARIANDLAAVLTGAGIPQTLIDRTMNDLGPFIRSPALPPVDLRTILTDLANVLAARPAALPRVGSWWYGGAPTGM